jgi:hypothetical protein
VALCSGFNTSTYRPRKETEQQLLFWLHASVPFCKIYLFISRKNKIYDSGNEEHFKTK